MNLRKIFTIRCAIILIAASVNYTQLHACDCMGKATVAMAYNTADVVLEGIVLSKTIVLAKDRILPNSMDGAMLHYVFEVKTFFKGKCRKKKVVVVTGVTEGTCGYVFEVGKRYIVYANNYQAKQRHKQYLSTNLCTRNCESNTEELAQLAAIKSQN
jgi:hypothetical protein